MTKRSYSDFLFQSQWRHAGGSIFAESLCSITVVHVSRESGSGARPAWLVVFEPWPLMQPDCGYDRNTSGNDVKSALDGNGRLGQYEELQTTHRANWHIIRAIA